jgi:hypothetical protein
MSGGVSLQLTSLGIVFGLSCDILSFIDSDKRSSYTIWCSFVWELNAWSKKLREQSCLFVRRSRVGGTFTLPMLPTPSRVETVCVQFVFTSLFGRPWNRKCWQNPAAITARKGQLLLLLSHSIFSTRYVFQYVSAPIAVSCNDAI